MLRGVIFAVCVVGCLGIEPRIPIPLPDSRIVGGIETDIGQHPHQLSLQTTGHICGASIISSNWAITAAHCVGLPANRYSLRAGNNNKNLGTRYLIDRIIKHPNYDSRTVDYDVALLEVHGSFHFTVNVKPVRLATDEPKSGAVVKVTGWGTLREGGQTSDRLMEVSVPIVGRATCQGAYQKMNKITDRMICAGYTNGGKDACQGDSGGPLTMSGTLYGIVSWGYGCAKPQYPGVYTNVANLRSWIKSTSGV